MSATLTARDVSAAHADRTLFSDLDLIVAPGDVIGLVGANGAGKSTLLKVLAGLETPDRGTVLANPPGAAIGYLPQEPDRRPEETVSQFLARRTGVSQAQRELDEATEALTRSRPGADDAYSAALDRWLALGAADLEERGEQISARLRLLSSGAGLTAEMTTLSGGQAARAGLASLLLSRYDIFLLDEPTNDLDLDGLAQLEDFVLGLRAGVVLVSHDREFLARTVTSVVELDLAQQQVSVFGGGYTAYLTEREVARRHARQAYEEYAGALDHLQARGRTQRAWMEKGVRNARRKSTDSDKFGKNFRAETSEKQAAKAAQTDRMIERLEAVDEPRKEWQLQFEIAAASRAGAVVATASAAVVRRHEFRLGPVDLEIGWGDRVAITGPNGSGKTTLLRLLLGRIQPASGSARLGPGVIVGEIDQARSRFTGNNTLATTFGELVPELNNPEVRTLLAKFGLGSYHVLRPASSLSPGERTRAGLALLQARGVNLLVLDEPTNHLDLPAIEELERALGDFPGTVLLVSHDRRLLETVPLNRRLAVSAGQVTEVNRPQ